MLAGAPSVTALVSAARINWGEHPQGIGNPYVVLSMIANSEGITMQGPDGFYQGVVQVDCYAMKYKDVKLIARAIHSVLHGYREGNFRLITHDSERDSREGGSGEAEMLHRVSLDFSVNWRV